jgi:hypothetical protein
MASSTRWTDDQVREYVLAHLRARYARHVAWVKNHELANADARRAGVSFADRESLHGRRIRWGHEETARLAAAGQAAKSARYSAEAIVAAEPWDGATDAYGFEQAVRDYYDLWERFELSTPPLELSPVKV